MSPSLTSPLAQYLAGMQRATRERSPAMHVELGAVCVSPADLARLRRLAPQLAAKTARVIDSPRLRLRLELLQEFLASSRAAGRAELEVAFALYYFLKGYDLIPDSVPEVGLLDDALIVEAALRRNEHDLRTHWAALGRPWPEAV